MMSTHYHPIRPTNHQQKEGINELGSPELHDIDGRTGHHQTIPAAASTSVSPPPPNIPAVTQIEVAPTSRNGNSTPTTSPKHSHYARLEQTLIDASEVDSSELPTIPLTRLQRLAAAPIFQILIAGAGFTCDAYDLFVMNLVIVLLQFEFSESSGEKSLIADAVLAGSVVGQLLFGALADHIGRRIGFICTLSLLTIGATLSAFSFEVGSFSIFQCLALFRFILGVGIGGEYPLAATVSSEASPEVSGRGRRVAGVFSMQGLGSVLAPCVVLALLAMAGPGHISVVWRMALALGALPGLVMIYFRLQMKESKVFTESQREAQRSNGAATSTSSRWSRFFSSESFAKYRELRYHWKDLMGTAGSWFIFDVIFYGNGLFSSTVMGHWYSRPDGTDTDVHRYLVAVASATLILGLCALPGYWCSIFAIDVVGRRRLQLIGYAGMILSYSLCGVLLPVLTEAQGLFFFLYGLTFFFCNFGPNVTTFVVPSEIFPTSVRATAHGLSAAAGKMGAVLGGLIFPALLPNQTDQDQQATEEALARVMYLCAFLSAVGGIWTLIFTRESQFLELSTQQPSQAGVELQTMEADDPSHPSTGASHPRTSFSTSTPGTPSGGMLSALGEELNLDDVEEL